jgi:hypothetical protein
MQSKLVQSAAPIGPRFLNVLFVIFLTPLVLMFVCCKAHYILHSHQLRSVYILHLHYNVKYSSLQRE